MKNPIACLLLLLWGCSQESSLPSKANSGHQLRARWDLKFHTLQGGAPEDYAIEVWEKGDTFRAHVNSTIPSVEGVTQEECDILCDGKKVWQFNHTYVGSEESEPASVYEIKDPKAVEYLRFWRVPSTTYSKEGSEKILGRDCVHLKTVGQDVTQSTVEVHCWIDPNLGYLLKRKNTNGGELYGGQLECIEVEANPSFTSEQFNPPAQCRPSTTPPSLWGSGPKI